MAHRHTIQKRKSGGRTFYTGEGSNVAKEAEEKKSGGKVKNMGFASGGRTASRIKKARGGGIGADKSPFSSAGAGGMNNHPADHGKGDVSGGGAFVGARGK